MPERADRGDGPVGKGGVQPWQERAVRRRAALRPRGDACAVRGLLHHAEATAFQGRAPRPGEHAARRRLQLLDWRRGEGEHVPREVEGQHL